MFCGCKRTVSDALIAGISSEYPKNMGSCGTKRAVAIKCCVTADGLEYSILPTSIPHIIQDLVNRSNQPCGLNKHQLKMFVAAAFTDSFG